MALNFDLETALETLRKYSYKETQRYAVFVLATNLDLLQKPADAETILGLFIYVGSYNTRGEAQKQQTVISALTGFPSAIIVETGVHRSFGVGHSKDALTYPRERDAGVDQIVGSIENARRRCAEIRQRVVKENEDRKDPNSMASATELIYLAMTHAKSVRSFKEKIRASRKKTNEYEEQIVTFFTQNPSLLYKWEAETEPLLKERGEAHIFEDMRSYFEKRLKARVTAAVSGNVFSSDDDSESLFELSHSPIFAGSRPPEFLAETDGRQTDGKQSAEVQRVGEDELNENDYEESSPFPPISSSSSSSAFDTSSAHTEQVVKDSASGTSSSELRKKTHSTPISTVKLLEELKQYKPPPELKPDLGLARRWRNVLVGNTTVDDFNASLESKSGTSTAFYTRPKTTGAEEVTGVKPPFSSKAASSSRDTFCAPPSPSSTEWRSRGQRNGRGRTSRGGRGRDSEESKGSGTSFAFPQRIGGRGERKETDFRQDVSHQGVSAPTFPEGEAKGDTQRDIDATARGSDRGGRRGGSRGARRVAH